MPAHPPVFQKIKRSAAVWCKRPIAQLLIQHIRKSLGSIRIERRDGDYVAEFVGGDVDEILDKIADE